MKRRTVSTIVFAVVFLATCSPNISYPTVEFVQVEKRVPIYRPVVVEVPRIYFVRLPIDRRQLLVVGMTTVAWEDDGYSFGRLESKCGRLNWDVTTIADIALNVGPKYDVAPELLVAVAWHESRWCPDARHDQGRGCGLTGVRTDFDSRPSCKWLLDPANSFEWTARKLDAFRNDEGKIVLSRYNGGGVGAQQYERDVWRTTEQLLRVSRRTRR